MSAVAGWIRPWYPAGLVGHISRDCPELLKHVSEPVDGSGWLDPDQAVRCATCMPPWNAECRACHSVMSEEWQEDEPFSEADANRWKRKHRCPPDVHVIPPPRPKTSQTPAGQVLLPLL
ncbi:hypothetical protein ITP53_16765 [Nonomuraea sp. K274]|uniref:Uncharacterized protein n=1 Tax=Nonomuraea cypriaca TaxID=1187855 RepID=A0A931EYI6_9ACTN|nr:hypothetical protein [Nonomuraea cypriaca]MBF8187355.1 hypothetical protein [Nonomuraea cypriaca]